MRATALHYRTAYLPMPWLGRHLIALSRFAPEMTNTLDASLLSMAQHGTPHSSTKQVAAASYARNHTLQSMETEKHGAQCQCMATPANLMASRVIFSLKCCLPAWRPTTLPLPVTLRRLAAACEHTDVWSAV